MTDLSWAAINALCRSCNNIDIKKYLDQVYEIIVNQDYDLLESLTAIKLCSSHMTKNIKEDVKKHFKREHVPYVAAILGGIFNVKSFKEIDKYIKMFFTI